MNSRELHTHLTAFDSVHRTPSEGEQRTFLVLALHETEEDIGIAYYVIDPAVPREVGPALIFKLTAIQHIAVSAQKALQPVLSTHVERIMQTRTLVEKIGFKTVTDMLNESDTAEEFKHNLLHVLEKFGINPEQIEFS